MKFTRLVAATLILGSLGVGSLMAQTGPGATPAEFPPASYKGKQYVDSAGCVFIRAGIDGNVTWVPRVTRKRQGVCGFKPTFAGQVTEAAPAPAQTAAAPETITNPAPAAAPVPKPRPARVVRAPAPKPQVVRQVARRPAPIVEAPAPVIREATGVATACPNLSPVGQRYTRQSKLAVRCGPQQAPIVANRSARAEAPAGVAAPVRRTVTTDAAPIRVSPNRRIVPRHVAVNRVNTTNGTVPKGYKRVWEDGRLNPHRAEQTLAGHRAMSLIWTSTVPRRLINQADGRDVTASVPLVYPYVDYARQQEELGEVTIVRRNGQILKRIRRGVDTTLHPGQNRQARVATVQRQPTYSSRSGPVTAPKAATAQRAQPKAEVAGKGYVQAGAFDDAAAAHARAKRIQRMGLPVRVGRYTRDGKTTRLVIAGPFAGDRAVRGAIRRLRGAGYEAFAR